MSKIIVKIGSNLLTRDDFSLNTSLLQKICNQIALIQKQGNQVAIVTSGAVAAGRHDYVAQPKDENLTTQQLLASIGQCRLLDKYHNNFKKHNLVIAQALLTNRNFNQTTELEQIAKVINTLLAKGYIPIINENDVTSTAELKQENNHFGDNDMLSAKTAVLIQANQLVLLTDVDGVYNCNPKTNQAAKLLHLIKKNDENIFCFAEEHKSNISRGGMETKLQAAKLASQHQIETFIANGIKKNVLVDLLIKKKENIGTKFIV